MGTTRGWINRMMAIITDWIIRIWGGIGVEWLVDQIMIQMNTSVPSSRDLL